MEYYDVVNGKYSYVCININYYKHVLNALCLVLLSVAVSFGCYMLHNIIG